MKNLNGLEAIRKATERQRIDLVKLIAATAIWIDPELYKALREIKTNETGCIYPKTQRRASKTSKVIVPPEIKIDIKINNYPNVGFKKCIKPLTVINYTVCHVYEDTARDHKYHTSIPNLVMLPNAIEKLSDKGVLPKVSAALKYQSYLLYGFFINNKPQCPMKNEKQFREMWLKPISLSVQRIDELKKQTEKNLLKRTQ